MKKLFILALSAVLFWNCNSEDDSSNSDNNEPEKTMVIQQITHTKEDVSITYAFEYNEDDTISKIIEKQGEDVLNTYEMDYSGEEINGVFINKDSDDPKLINLTYEDNKISFNLGDSFVQNTYTNSLLRESFYYESYNSEKKEKEVYYNISDESISSMIVKEEVIVNGKPVQKAITYSYTLDDKYSPYANLSPEVKFLLFILFDDINALNKYNITEEKLGGTITRTRASLYGSDNYPIQTVITEIGGGEESFLYVYKEI
ncbi:MAG: hypothetical protein H6604_07050 [Flavobacteriales bacterium]|nr:hypothetical protein [Flavobacteriales bacterium]